MDRFDSIDAIAVTMARPWGNGFPGEIRRDQYSHILYRWNDDDGVWDAFGTTEQDVALYVNVATGNDANDGAVATPLASITEAGRRLNNLLVLHSIQVSVAAGAYEDPVFRNLRFSGYDIVTGANGEIRVIGSTSINVAVAAAAGNVGTARSLQIVPNPGWAVDAYRGKIAVFTAGTHNSLRCMILRNTADTLYFGSVDIGAPYDNTDALTIYDLDTIVTGTGFFEAPVSIHDVGRGFIEDLGLQFYYFDFGMDGASAISIGQYGSSHAYYRECWFQGAFQIEGSLISQYIDRCGSGVVDSMLGDFYIQGALGALHLDLYRSGIDGSLMLPDVYDVNVLGSNCALFEGGIGQALSFHRGHVNFADSWIDGETTGYAVLVPIGATAKWVFYRCYIEQSIGSGIDCLGIVGGTFDLASNCDIRNNAVAGVHLRGPVAVEIGPVVTSSVNNGTYGLSLRDGAKVHRSGANPTITGALGDIDMGPGILPLAWAGVPATDVTELTRIS